MLPGEWVVDLIISRSSFPASPLLFPFVEGGGVGLMELGFSLFFFFCISLFSAFGGIFWGGGVLGLKHPLSFF